MGTTAQRIFSTFRGARPAMIEDIVHGGVASGCGLPDDMTADQLIGYVERAVTRATSSLEETIVNAAPDDEGQTIIMIIACMQLGTEMTALKEALQESLLAEMARK